VATNHIERDIGQLQAVRTLVERARAGLLAERREGRRFPFFQPVIVSNDLDGTVSLSAFSRDISAWGIGLLCYWPLRLRPVNLKIYFSDDEEISVGGFVRWCHPCGQGWYVAGVSFADDECDDLTYEIGGFTG
jgi:hypothetical protein